MRVLVVSSKYQPEYSGSGLRAHNTYKRLEHKFGVQWDVLAGSQVYTKSFTYEYDDKNIDIISSIFSPKPLWIRNQKKYNNFLLNIIGFLYFIASYIVESVKVFYFLKDKTDKYDVIHTFGDNAVVSSCLFWAYLKNKKVLKELTTIRKHSFNIIERSFLPKKFRDSIQFIAISVMLKKVIIKDGYQQVWQRGNPVDQKLFFPLNKEKKRVLRNTLYDKNHINKKILLYVAKYVKNKNHIFLLDVISYLKDDYVLYLMGPNDDANDNIITEIKSKIKQLNINNRVVFKCGFIKNFNEYLMSCDVYLFPSFYEGLGTQIIECLFTNTPIVSNKLIDITNHYIKNGVNGYACTLDAKVFADCIIQSQQFDIDKLDKHNEQIRQTTNTKIIDEQYYQLLKKLVYDQ